MKKSEITRARFLQSAGELLQRQGYRGAGLNQIIEASGAPRGSLYFHFPGGKDELVCAALSETAEQWRQGLEAAIDAAPDLEQAIRGTCAMLARELEDSGFRRGCPLATATLEVASDNDAIQAVSARHYESWERAIAERLAATGIAAPAAARFARFALSAIEGALLLSRAYRDTAPLTDVADMLVGSLGSLRA